MYALEDDTLSCKPCYEDSYRPSDIVPAHREVHAEVQHGECACCGIIAGETLDEWEERMLGSSELSHPEEDTTP